MKIAKAAAVAVAILAAPAAVAPAFADSPFALTQTIAFKFQYDRSALRTSEGEQTVYSALVGQASSACSDRGELTTRRAEREENAACIDQLVSATLKSMGNTNLLAIHDARVIESASLQ